MADHTTGHGAIRGKGCPGCCADAIETVLDEEEIGES